MLLVTFLPSGGEKCHTQWRGGGGTTIHRLYNYVAL